MVEQRVENEGFFPEVVLRASEPEDIKAGLRAFERRRSRRLVEVLVAYEENALGLLNFTGVEVTRVANGFRVASPQIVGQRGGMPGRSPAGPAAVPESSRWRAESRMQLDARRLLGCVKAIRDAIAEGRMDDAMKECINLGCCNSRLVARPHEYAASVGTKRLKSQAERPKRYLAVLADRRQEMVSLYREVRPLYASNSAAYRAVASSMDGGCAKTVERAVKAAAGQGGVNGTLEERRTLPGTVQTRG